MVFGVLGCSVMHSALTCHTLNWIFLNDSQKFFSYQRLIFGAVIESTRVHNKISPEARKGTDTRKARECSQVQS